MIAVAPAIWAVRPPRWVPVFQGVMVAGAILAASAAFWSVLHDSVMARGMVALALVFLGVGGMVQHKRRCRSNARKPVSLQRLAPSHWRVIFTDGGVVDGRLCKVWRGWAWVTLKIQPHGQHKGLTLTVWRATVPGSAWHQLQAWATWELAMSRPDHSRRPRVEPF